MKNEKEVIGVYKINDKEYPIVLIKKDYQKNIYCRFKEDHFEITAYRKHKLNEKLIYNLVSSLAKKIEKSGKLAKNEEEKGFIYFLGNKYKLIDNKYIEIENDLISINYFVNNVIIKKIAEEFERYRIMMEVPAIYKLSFRNMKTRYGTNSKRTKKITLSSELFKYSIELIDSVIVHELAHYYVFNHSEKFYNIIYKYYPSYKEARKKLIKRIYK